MADTFLKVPKIVSISRHTEALNMTSIDLKRNAKVITGDPAIRENPAETNSSAYRRTTDLGSTNF